MESPRYYPCRVQLDGSAKFVAWFTANLDGFLRDPCGRLVTANATGEFGVPLETVEPVVYDFDRIRAWCAHPATAGVECRAFLDAWNFLDDLTGLYAGVDSSHTRLSRASAEVYGKLFWGNNLPAVTPRGERFDPSWSPEELAAIRDVFESGLGILQAELAGSAPDAEPVAAPNQAT